MSATPRFHELTVSRIDEEAAGSVAVTLAVPAALRETFAFEPGQFLTLRATIQGQDVRRSYSICSTRSRLRERGELQVGIRPVEGGVFSNWAAQQLKAGESLRVMPPEGRFVVQRPRAIHRVGFASGSGITPILSIMASTLEEQAGTKFTLVYGNRRMSSVMFNEALQDLKDRFPDRLTLIHILSRQAQEVDLLQGRIDRDKVRAIVDTLLPVGSMDEVFICGPEAMIEATENTLLEAGLSAQRIRTERFVTAGSPAPRGTATAKATESAQKAPVRLTVMLDGKEHEMTMHHGEFVLDVALNNGLDLPYSCKGGVCVTCRTKVMQGEVEMEKNFGLDDSEVQQGYVLSCQAHPKTPHVVVSFDER